MLGTRDQKQLLLSFSFTKKVNNVKVLMQLTIEILKFDVHDVIYLFSNLYKVSYCFIGRIKSSPNKAAIHVYFYEVSAWYDQ